MKETIKLNDEREVEVNCRYLSTRKAFQIFENSIDIKNMKMIDVERLVDGKKVIVQEPSMEGKLNGLVSLSWKCFDECVETFPDKDNVSPDEVIRIYKKYAEKIMNGIMGSQPSPKSSGS